MLACGVAAGLSLRGRSGLAALAPDYTVEDIALAGDRDLGRRMTLLVPSQANPDRPVPLLVLLHGLGETHDEQLGVYAWLNLYGLAGAYERLRSPPIKRTVKHSDWSDRRLEEVNAELRAQPFGDMVIACPFTPNVGKLAMGRAAALEGYAKWITETVVPHARSVAPVITGRAHTHLDGCSLGGYVGLEVFLRKPETFGAWGGVQSAFGAHRAEGYATRLAEVTQKLPKTALHLLTSEGDPFRPGNTALAKALEKRSVPHDLRILPGPHNQPWLRETGTIEMLHWHDRVLKGHRPPSDG